MNASYGSHAFSATAAVVEIDPPFFAPHPDYPHPLARICLILLLTIACWSALIGLGLVFGMAVPIALYVTGCLWLTYEMTRAQQASAS